jgi:hypothetical protein
MDNVKKNLKDFINNKYDINDLKSKIKNDPQFLNDFLFDISTYLLVNKNHSKELRKKDKETRDRFKQIYIQDSKSNEESSEIFNLADINEIGVAAFSENVNKEIGINLSLDTILAFLDDDDNDED